MRFNKLDLNLLVALDILLKERNVSIAADRLNLSQSAMSGALTRLRLYFDDALLERSGQKLILTARAEELIDPVRLALQHIEQTITTSSAFAPETCDRRFTISASDYGMSVIIAPALRQIAQKAPKMTFLLRYLSGSPVEMLERSRTDILLLGAHGASPDHPSRFLFGDDFVVVACCDNVKLEQGLTKELYFDLGHVTVQLGETPYLYFENWMLRQEGRTRKLEISAPSFSALPSLISGTDRLATMHRRHAKLLADDRYFTIFELPFAGFELSEALQWSRLRNDDRALMWVIDQIDQSIAE